MIIRLYVRRCWGRTPPGPALDNLTTLLPLEIGGGAFKSVMAQVPGLETDLIGLGCSLGIRIFKSSHMILPCRTVLQPVIQW